MRTPTALASEARRKQGTAWRVAGDQHTPSTRKLVDTRRDQEILEDILEATKPPVPRDADTLHYLLQTPFRYNAPYPVGSRFRRAGSTDGVFYASGQVRTALAEMCHYRIRFFSEAPDAMLPASTATPLRILRRLPRAPRHRPDQSAVRPAPHHVDPAHRLPTDTGLRRHGAASQHRIDTPRIGARPRRRHQRRHAHAVGAALKGAKGNSNVVSVSVAARSQLRTHHVRGAERALDV